MALPSDTLRIILDNDRQAYFKPGDSIRGRIVAVFPSSHRSSSTSLPTQKTLQSFKLEWKGAVTTCVGDDSETQTFFATHWSLQKQENDLYKLVHTTSQDRSQHPVALSWDTRHEFPFECAVPSNAPSSFEISDPAMDASARIHYRLSATVDHQQFDPLPLKSQHTIRILDEWPQDAEQQSREQAYKALVSQKNGSKAEYRSALRVTVPSRVYPRGESIPVALQIWHGCPYKRERGISIALLSIYRIRCKDRAEVVIEKPIQTTDADLKLSMRSDYAIQTLTTQLTIPQDTSVNVRMEHAFLVAVEYKIEAQVQAHPDALYTPLSDDAPFSSMAVDIPLSLTVNQSSNIPKIDVHTAPASHCDLHCHLTREVTGSGVKKRMQNMFRRKPSSKSASQSSYDQSSVAEKKSSRPGFLSFRSSSKANAREGSISSFVTGSSGALAPPSQFHQQQRHLPDDPSATVPPALTPSTLSQASQSQVFQSPNTYDNEDMPTPDSPPPKYTSKDSDSPQNPSWASSPGASVGANNVTYFEMFPDSESEPEEQDEPVEGLNVTDKHKGKERTVGHEVDQQEQPKEHEQLQQETEQQELLPAIPPPPPRAFVPPSPPSPQKEVPSQSTHRHVDDKPDLVSESESEDGSSDEDDLLAIMARREKRIERKRNSQRRADRE